MYKTFSWSRSDLLQKIVKVLIVRGLVWIKLTNLKILKIFQTAVIHCSAENKQLHCIVFHILWCTLLWTPQIKELYICYTNPLQRLLLPHKINVSYYQLLNSLYPNHMKLANMCDDLSFGKAFPLLFFQAEIPLPPCK